MAAEVRLATWREVDLVSMVWTIPEERMKAKRQHRIPLSKRAVEVLRAAEQLRPSPQPHELVFTSVRGRRIDASVVSKMVTRLGIDAVPHGFRSSFRDWASERTDHPREVVEAALAHTVRDQTEAAYARVGPVRAPPAPDGRLGGLPEGAAGAGGDAGPVTGW